ncbi:pyridoxal-phosphate dependent enzyme [uncultured Flavobacterium sp.]|uniref:1-aminocyclopropane-1-carboxylate deaminase/D-cysteine desulfhydrase n=1 Tax=uncultured Flavobacterium sp. TaxID=165435 RepID=UPI0030EB8CA6|tara:strand:+ start:7161 stop:8066 length:906 start_codon:yes stop_codon:yes gene_type:complete
MKIITQKISLNNPDLELYIRREDLIHPLISGNKFRKLKYNLIQAKTENQSTLLTFGGAFSNHILAVASAGFENNFKTIGVIRGEELIYKIEENQTLKKAQELGMQFKFVTREEYRNKTNKAFLINLQNEFGSFYLLPEGGTNNLAIKGCEEILTNEDTSFTHICCSIGTGGTISGIINSSFDGQQIVGFPSLKGDFISNEISNFANKSNWNIISDYHFGGYGKITEDLIRFINEFYTTHKIPLDPIYTGKMMFGIDDLIQNNYFPKGSKILAIHTGGLQGINGMNTLLEKQKKETIITDEI